MIRYALACANGHEFESWFPGSDAYEAQAARGLVTCPLCDSDRVQKRIMAPSVARSDRPSPGPETPALPVAPEPPVPARPVVALSEGEREIRAMLKAIREHVTKTADYVGPAFAEEARKMHYGEAEHRSIYGEADLADARELLEEGIAFQPLPMLPDDRN